MAFRPTHEKREEKERTRLALLRAALQLSAVHGFASLGLREVSREAGIAPTSFYRHFADMEELGAALVRDLIGPVLREISESTEHTPLVPALVDCALRLAQGEPDVLRFFVSERVGAFAGLRGLLRAELAVLANTVHSALGRGPSRLVMPPPTAAELTVALLLDGCAKVLDGAPTDGALRDGLIWGLGRLLGIPEMPEGPT